MDESNNKKVIVICNWCMRPGEGTLSINLQEQIKKFCTESCFSRWRRSIFKYEKICDSCKKDIKCVQSPFFYYLKEYDQHFHHCSYLCFLSFKELLSYNMIKSNSFNKFMNHFFSQNIFYGMIKQESSFDFNMMENKLHLDQIRKDLTKQNSKVISIIDIFSRKCT